MRVLGYRHVLRVLRMPGALPLHGSEIVMSRAHTICSCGNLSNRAQQNGEREARKLARRRFQKGSLFLRGKHQPVWTGRWLEDEIQQDGRVCRVHRSEIIGTRREFPTRRLAFRELQARLDVVNSPTYRARPTATFAQFSARWESTVLIQHKPSTQATIRSQLRKYLVPSFGKLMMRDVQPETVQRFVSSLKVSPKTARNLYATLQMIWKSARFWQYAAHDALAGIVLQKQRPPRQFFFTVEMTQRIIAAASEPYKTFYWFAAETGMRAGELCGLRTDDLDLEHGLVHVCQSVWRGKVQSPKTANAVRAFALSPQVVGRLREYLKQWRPNERRLLFATRNGTPWDANLLVKRKLRPLLRSIGIDGGGLHAFRHANSSFMDRLSVPIKVRQQRLGHSDPRLTLGVYTHVVSEDDLRTAEQLGELLSGIPCPNLPKLQNEGVARIEQPLLN
jgi:integrase